MGILKGVKRAKRRNKMRLGRMIDNMKDSLSYTLKRSDGQPITMTGLEWRKHFGPGDEI